MGYAIDYIAYKLLNGLYKTKYSDIFTVGGREGFLGHEKKLANHASSPSAFL